MYSFLFRKTIFDAWDNVLSFFLANFGYLWLFALEFFWLHLNATGKLDLPPCVLLMVLTMIAISFYSMLTAVFAHNILTGKKRGQVLEGAGNIIRTHIGHIFFHAFIRWCARPMSGRGRSISGWAVSWDRCSPLSACSCPCS